MTQGTITRVSDKYYIVTSEDPPFKETPGKAVPFPGRDLFVHECDTGWKVTEAMSGRMVMEGGKQLATVRAAKERLGNCAVEYLSKVIADNIRQGGLSPRYQFSPGLTKDYVDATMCLTGETSGKPKEKSVARKSNNSEQVALPDTGGVIAVQDPVPTTGQLEVVSDANVMSAEDAIRIEGNIEKSSSNVSKWLMQLYRGKAYVSRGFPTWEAYYADVTGKSRASAYRAVDEAIQKEKLIEMGVPAKFNAKQIAALKPVIEQGKEAIEAVLKDAKKIVTAKDANEKVKSEFHNSGVLPASALRKAVEKIVPPAPKADAGAVDVTEQVKPKLTVVSQEDVTSEDIPLVDAPQAQIDTEAPSSPIEAAKPDTGNNVHLLHFAACAWHVGADTGIPTGCLKVETKEGGYVLVPYSAMFEAYNSWPQEFLTDAGEVAEP